MNALLGLLCDREAMIFDLDGTIVDSNELHAEAFQRTLAEVGITDFVYSEYAGRRTDDVFRDVLRRTCQRIDANLIEDLVTRKRRRVHRMLAQPLPFIPGAKRFIDLAVRAEKRLAIATSASLANALQSLSTCELDRIFEVVVTGDDVARAKPAPDIYTETVRRLRCAKQRCVAFEDAEPGYRAARLAGLETIVVGRPGVACPSWVPSGTHYATYQELIALLENGSGGGTQIC